MWLRRWTTALALGAVLAISLACSPRITLVDRDWSQLVDAHRHDVTIDGTRMHYVDLGSGDPVVMIHGIGDSTYSWHRNAGILAEAGFRVVLIDQPGFGRSAIPDAGWIYSIEGQAEAVLRVVDQIGIERFDLVGHSLGGGESLYLAWKHGDRVDRVAVLSPASQRTSCPFGIGTDLIAGVLGTRGFTSRVLRSAFYHAETLGEAEIDEYARLLDRPGRMGSGVLGGVCRDYFSPTYDRMTEGYREIRPELLILWGEQDSWHPVAFGTRLQAAVPGARLEVVPDAGHNLHQERADVVNAILIDFLRGKI